MKKRLVRVFVTLSVALLLSACASMSDKTEESNEATTMVYFASKAKPRPAPVPTPVVKEAIVQGIVYFDFDKYNIKPEFKEVIAQHARVLRDNPSIVAKVEGHTDVFGTNDYNNPLGLLRAKEVRAALIKLGVREQQLEPVSYSFSQPAVAGREEGARAKNRRAEIAYQI
ncbi:MAG: OmpA family protein [Sedimentisphaerales bacterium]|nr:OmpA family protein [Sedimentisphaerales bacterium]